MSVSTFNGQRLQQDLSDVTVNATDVDPSTVNKVKGWLRSGTTAIASLASRYAHKTGLGFSALKSYFTGREYDLRPLEELGVGGYFNPGDGKIVLNSRLINRDPAFVREASVHEGLHNYRWLNGSMERLGRGLRNTFSYLGGFGDAVASYVQRIYEEAAATRLTKKAYALMGMGTDVKGYSSLQPAFARIERQVGEERLFYNEERDGPLIANVVLSAMSA